MEGGAIQSSEKQSCTFSFMICPRLHAVKSWQSGKQGQCRLLSSSAEHPQQPGLRELSLMYFWAFIQFTN